MHAVVNRLRLASPVPAEDWARAQADLPERMRAVPGFVSCQVIELGDDEVVLVIVADSPATLDRLASEVGGPWMVEKVVPHLAEPPHRQIGTVVVSV